MNSLVNTLYNGATGVKKALCLLSVVLYVALTVYSGGSIIEIMLFGLLMIMYVWLPGKCWNMLLAADSRVSPTLAGRAALITVVNVYNTSRPKNSSTGNH